MGRLAVSVGQGGWCWYDRNPQSGLKSSSVARTVRDPFFNVEGLRSTPRHRGRHGQTRRPWHLLVTGQKRKQREETGVLLSTTTTARNAPQETRARQWRTWESSPRRCLSQRSTCATAGRNTSGDQVHQRPQFNAGGKAERTTREPPARTGTQPCGPPLVPSLEMSMERSCSRSKVVKCVRTQRGREHSLLLDAREGSRRGITERAPVKKTDET